MAKLRQWIALCSFSVVGCVVFVLFFYTRKEPVSSVLLADDIQSRSYARNVEMKPVSHINYKQLNAKTLEIQEFIEARNNLSKLLNIKQQELGRLQCELAAQNSKNKEFTSNTGGWCIQKVEEAGEHEQGGLHKTDKGLATALADFFKGKYVGSFGDGPGRYKALLLKTGLLKGYDAFDGAPYVEKISEGRVVFLDLTLPLYGLPLYDWIISLEVAEHIPKQFEAVYVDNLVRHAKEGLVISWAAPGQKGYSHVNNRPLDYVKTIMAQRGFEFDSNSSEALRKSAVVEWFKTNINVFRRTSVNDEMLKVHS